MATDINGGSHQASARRTILVERPDDKESWYYCECGFDDYLGETCKCPNCQKYKALYGLPLKHCPKCGTTFDLVPDDLEPGAVRRAGSSPVPAIEKT
jgi:hypothetical protein